MSTHNICFKQKYERYQGFLSEKNQFLEVKFSTYLNKRVFIMTAAKEKTFFPVSKDILDFYFKSILVVPTLHSSFKYHLYTRLRLTPECYGTLMQHLIIMRLFARISCPNHDPKPDSDC